MVRKILRSPIATVVLFVAAAALLLTGTIGGVQAAPRVASGDYRASVELASIETALLENGTEVADGGALLANLVGQGETFKVGKAYDERLSVRNTGTIGEYVRVTLYRYWTDGAGKAVDLDPELINVGFAQGSGWEVDKSASTPERTVLYYSEPLAPGEETPSLSDTLAIDGRVITSVTAVGDQLNYDYDDVTFHVEAVADAVQERNGSDAMMSAWGRTV